MPPARLRPPPIWPRSTRICSRIRRATAIDYAAQVSLAGETRLILESDGSPAYNFTNSWARGILYTTSSYNSPGTFAYPATAGADTLAGGDGPNQISGLAATMC